jgi:hypothetical protein
MMISVGVVGLLIATVDHRHTMKALEEEYGAKYRSITSALAAFIVVMGVGFLIVVLLHL